MQNAQTKIGVIGQGFVGGSYADDFEARGFDVVRYALEEPHVRNREVIADCDVVFIAVPTPTVPHDREESGSPTRFDASILHDVVKLIGAGKSAVIKSTIALGTTKKIQDDNPDIFVFHSPEFLTEATAAQDAAKPRRNIIGFPVDSPEYRERAELILALLPKAPFELACDAHEAELIKYGGNCWFYFKIVFMNMLYDLARNRGVRWEAIRDAMAADPRVGPSHLTPVHKSGTPGGDAYQMSPVLSDEGERGAGGHCFIKDFAAFVEMYEKYVGDDFGMHALRALEHKNIDLLTNSNKDPDLLSGVYGDTRAKRVCEHCQTPLIDYVRP